MRAVFSSCIPSCPVADITKIARAVSADMQGSSRRKRVDDVAAYLSCFPLCSLNGEISSSEIHIIRADRPENGQYLSRFPFFPLFKRF
jgi:hypothetical protein